ncbi:hypothetical protein [Chryseobacterium culicis]|uniref:hypothetical protein n=1 Tax=Chryseobacterium culicis TaxID=680127 RepID=UPI001874996F|nr:hypothetical protein [Chryseobacterium culicis]MBE4948142.1 hypothetical protein [Chryseobacterium culicis]
MENFDIVVRDNKNMLCQFFIGISADYENEITMNIAKIQKKVEDINMHTIEISQNYEKHFQELGFTIDNELYKHLLNKM